MNASPLIEAIQRSTPNEKQQAFVHLLREFIASKGTHGPLLVQEGPANGNVAFVLPIASEEHRQAVEEEALFLAALDERIHNPPERYLSSEEFLELLEQPI